MGATLQEQKVTGTLLDMFLSYNPDTGMFIRKLSTNSKSRAGDYVTVKNDEGYIIVTVMGARLRAHRVAWVWMTGRWPELDIDHINGDRSDNRFLNLRQATRSQNLQNAGLRLSNKTGHKGVHFCHERQKYVAQIKINKWPKVLGRFQTLEAAIEARQAAEKEFYGEFASPARPIFEKRRT
jgi:hypothetical protein